MPSLISTQSSTNTLTRCTEKTARAFALRLLCWSEEDIATELGYANVADVQSVISQALSAQRFETAEEAILLDLARLDLILKPFLELAKQGDPVAFDKVIKGMEHRARLLGLNAPTRIDLDIRAIDVAIEASLGELHPPRPPPHGGDRGHNRRRSRRWARK